MVPGSTERRLLRNDTFDVYATPWTSDKCDDDNLFFITYNGNTENAKTAAPEFTNLFI